MSDAPLTSEEAETWYWLTHKPTIAEVRRLNRESTALWPLSMLNALLDAGVDLDKESDAVLSQAICQTEDFIGAQIHCVLNGRLIAILGIGTHPDGGGGDYFAKTKRKPKPVETER